MTAEARFSSQAAEEQLPFSGLPPSALPTLEELGLSLDQIVGQPFGRDEQGRHIGGDSGPTHGILRALREAASARVEKELPPDLSSHERRRRVAQAQEAAVDQLIAMVNAAQPDRRYHLTKEYLEDRHNRFSFELWTFLAEYARIIACDRELIYRGGSYAIPPAVARLARPFGIEGTYRAIGRLAVLVVRNDLQTVATSPTSATIRWPGAIAHELVPEAHVLQYLALGCQAFRGALAAVPKEIGGQEKPAQVIEHQCRARGAAYCEWEFRWHASAAALSVKRYFVAPALASVAGAVAVVLRLPGGRLLGALGAAALPLVVAIGQRRIRQLAAERDREHELLLEQRELSELEFSNRSQAYMEIQQSNLELEHRVSELTTVNEVGRAVAGTLDLGRMLDASLAAIVEHGRYQRAMVLLHDPQRKVLTSGRSVGGSAEEVAVLERYEVDLRRKGSLLGRVFHSDGPVLVTDLAARTDGPARAFAAAIGTSSFLGTPLISQGRKLGVLAVDHGRSGRIPDEADKGLLFTIGSLIASAIERAQLYAEIERHSRELEDRVRQRTDELARATEEAESARWAAEERRQQLETILRHAPVATITLAEDGVTVTSWNPAAEQLFGYTAAEAKGRNIDDLVTNAELRAEGEEITRRAATAGGVKIVTRRAHREGHLVDVEIQAVPLLVAGGLAGGVAIYHDVTELLQARREAEAARQQAEAANEAKSRFLSNVSHELRTPLTSVLGFAKIIGKRLDEVILPAVDTSDRKREQAVRQVNDNLGIIVTEGERLTAMINNVLDLAKIESGRFEWRDEDVALPELLEHATSATAALFADKGLELRRVIADALPVVRGDRDRLLQVVINLLSNAVKFTDSGWVELRARREDGEVHVSISDTGMGIAAEDYDTVFEQFRQVGDTLTDKPRGTGLGLPISKEIVEHHGGRLWLESEPGRGSTFSFSLPMGKAADADGRPSSALSPAGEAPAAAPATADGQPVADRRPATADDQPVVLVADDDESTRALLRQELESRHYRVLEATDGRTTLDLARGSRLSLIVLDVLMPEPDGFDVAQSLKADPATADIPILMLTVLDAAERAARAGVDAYVNKPFDSDRLMAEVTRLCSQSPTEGAAVQ